MALGEHEGRSTPGSIDASSLATLRQSAAAARRRYEESRTPPSSGQQDPAPAPQPDPHVADRLEQRLEQALAAQSEAWRQAATARQRYEETWRAKQALEARFEESLGYARQAMEELRRQRDQLAQDLERIQSEHDETESLRQALAQAQGALTAARTAEVAQAKRCQAEQDAFDPALPARTAATVRNLNRLAMHPELFDPAYYLASNPDVAKAGLDPGAHFLAHGWREGRPPHALAAQLREGPPLEMADIQAGRRLFDPDFYRSRNPDLADAPGDLYLHYCDHGWREGRDPNPLFSTALYQQANPDVGLAGVNPLLHYVLIGWRERRDIGGLFDAPFYAACPEADEVSFNPLEHFVFHGLATGRRPNAALDPTVFLTEAELAQGGWTGVKLFLERLQPLVATLVPAPLPQVETPRFSVIVRARDNLGAVLACVMALAPALAMGAGEVLLADAGSRDLLPLVAQGWTGVRYLPRLRRESWAATVNAAAREARGNLLVVVDATVSLSPGWAEAVLEALEYPGAGAVAGQVLDVSGTLQDAGGLLWNDASLTVRGVGQDPTHPRYAYLRPVDAPGPDLLAVPAERFWHLGGLKTGYACPRASLADFALRLAQEGASVLYQPFFQGVRFADPDPIGFGVADRQRLLDRFADALAALPPPSDQEALHLRGVVGHVLCIDQACPVQDQDAGSLRQVQTMKILLGLGWAVTFVPEATMAANPPYTEQLQRLGVQCVHRPAYQNLYEFVRDEGASVDLALLYKGPSAAHYRRIIEPHCPKARFVVETCDIHYLRELRQAELSGDPEALRRALEVKRIELETIANSHCTIILSTHEEVLLHQEIPDARLALTSLVMDCPGPQVPPEALRDICFIGGYRHKPNCSAVHFFVQDIWPLIRSSLPGVRFRIMGSHPPPDIQALASQDVVVDGFVPDLTTSLARCRLSVVPLLYGAGIKGKIGSSLSYGIPCVTTSIGGEGMEFGPWDGVEVADEPAAFADKVVRLYTDQAYWERMSRGGLRLVEREYSLQAGARRFAAVLSGLGLPMARADHF